jgi:hypothetical protein
MPLRSTISRYDSMLNVLGKAGLNAMFPNDFEVYIIAFELVDSLDNTIEFFSLPILPNSINVSEPELTNIKKVNGGVTSLKTDTFVPKDITLQGNFGRNFKILIRNKLLDFHSFKGVLNMVKGDFQGTNIKTGYGTIKVFQDILEGSKSIDKFGNPMRLYFYNFAFSENYVVEVIDKSFNQSRDSSNMIWNYSVNLKAVAPINNSVRDKNSLLGIVKASTMQKGINNLSSNIQRVLPKVKNKVQNTIKNLHV